MEGLPWRSCVVGYGSPSPGAAAAVGGSGSVHRDVPAHVVADGRERAVPAGGNAGHRRRPRSDSITRQPPGVIVFVGDEIRASRAASRSPAPACRIGSSLGCTRTDHTGALRAHQRVRAPLAPPRPRSRRDAGGSRCGPPGADRATDDVGNALGELWLPVGVELALRKALHQRTHLRRWTARSYLLLERISRARRGRLGSRPGSRGRAPAGSAHAQAGCGLPRCRCGTASASAAVGAVLCGRSVVVLGAGVCTPVSGVGRRPCRASRSAPRRRTPCISSRGNEAGVRMPTPGVDASVGLAALQRNAVEFGAIRGTGHRRPLPTRSGLLPTGVSRS